MACRQGWHSTDRLIRLTRTLVEDSGCAVMVIGLPDDDGLALMNSWRGSFCAESLNGVCLGDDDINDRR